VPVSTIRVDRLDALYSRWLCYNIVSFWQELWEKKHFDWNV